MACCSFPAAVLRRALSLLVRANVTDSGFERLSDTVADEQSAELRHRSSKTFETAPAAHYTIEESSDARPLQHSDADVSRTSPLRIVPWEEPRSATLDCSSPSACLPARDSKRLFPTGLVRPVGPSTHRCCSSAKRHHPASPALARLPLLRAQADRQRTAQGCRHARAPTKGCGVSRSNKPRALQLLQRRLE
eukprot:3561957-Prymnesium_polylepis.1